MSIARSHSRSIATFESRQLSLHPVAAAQDIEPPAFSWTVALLGLALYLLMDIESLIYATVAFAYLFVASIDMASHPFSAAAVAAICAVFVMLFGPLLVLTFARRHYRIARVISGVGLNAGAAVVLSPLPAGVRVLLGLHAALILIDRLWLSRSYLDELGRSYRDDPNTAEPLAANGVQS